MLSGVTALMGIATRLRLARLFFVTDGRADDLVAAAVDGGADVIALHNDRLTTREALRTLEGLRRAATTRQPLIAFQGPADIAGEFGADALVLASDDLFAAGERRALHPWAVVGRACNAAAEVDAALADPAVDFLLVGPGLDHIKHAAELAPQHDPAAKPWFAIGGVTLDTLDIVLEAGARRVAVGRAIAAASDPAGTAAEFAERLREVWNADPRMEAVTLGAFGEPRAHLTLGPAGEPPDDGLHL